MNIFLQVVSGYLLADFLIAFFHWYEDTYIDYNTKNPLLKSIGKYNTLHHFYPRSIVSNSFLGNIDISLKFTIIFLLIIYILNKDLLINYWIFFLVLSIFSILSNYLHKITHQRDCENNSIIKFLQKIGLIMSHNEHSIHHAVNSSIKFGVINDYTNYIYDYLDIWRKLENTIKFIFGISPCHKPVMGEYFNYYDDRLLELVKSECPRPLTHKELNEIYFKILDDIYNNYNENEFCAKYNGKINKPIEIPNIKKYIN